jgi:hypothetical protein
VSGRWLARRWRYSSETEPTSKTSKTPRPYPDTRHNSSHTRGIPTPAMATRWRWRMVLRRTKPVDAKAKA